MDLLEHFSQLILDLYRAFDRVDPHLFRDWALSRLQQDISFDSAIWIQGVLVENIPVTNSVYLHDLPADMLHDYARWASEDSVFEAVMCNPGRCVLMRDIKDLASWHKTDLYREYMSKYGMEDVAAIMVPFGCSGIQSFISLYRNRRDQPFTESERNWFQAVSHHLIEAENFSRFRHLRHHHSIADKDASVAVISAEGYLKMAEAGFIHFIDTGWPDWDPPLVPSAIIPSSANTMKTAHVLNGYLIKATHAQDGYVVSTRSVRALDILSSREQQVATRIANGMPYKSVAKELGISPSTVTNHVNAIYAKLSVRSGAELRKAISQT
ncbi:helix-turn-helix transcriptional regulator [Sedimenticola hydrogenitrophicus]|uniref:helix-turn-helix transcriptional regulator n=1 Tax=Sedimenticola hydrogenitrophicus TaxID=2967975 RepID=UPI0021A40797|nr:helix-turn-helix transcriptional regulator [Sedimenticola hydrogenitrophicus]